MSAPKLTLTLRRRLDTLFAKRADIAEKAKALDEARRAIDAELLQLTEDAGGALETDLYKTSVVRTTRTVLSEELLLKHGVKPTVIAKAKVETQNKPYVKVTEKKADAASALAVAKGA